MNIGIFTDAYYPQINGVVTSTRVLRDELTKLGHTVYIITSSDPRIKQKEPNTIRLPSMAFYALPAFRMSVAYSPKALRQIRRLNLDIIHTQTEFSLGIFGKMVSKLLDLPLVHTYHTMYPEYTHYIAHGKIITPKMARDFSRIFCNSANFVVAPTRKVERFLIGCGVTKPIAIIPTGLNLEPFKKSNYSHADIAQLKEDYGIGADNKVILFVGRLGKEKSLDFIIRALPALINRLPEIKFLIVGNGPAKDGLVKLSESLNINEYVIFTGEQPWESIGKFYSMGDVFASASVSETQCLTYVEAMAASLPVAAKYDEFISGIIQDNISGKVFNTENELTDVLYDLLTDKSKSNEIIENAHRNIIQFSSTQFARSVESVYVTAVKNFTSSGRAPATKKNKTEKRKIFVLKP